MLTARVGKLLMVCYFYPPIHNSGVERSVQFARHLPEWGWKPLVFTTDAFGKSSEKIEGHTTRRPELLSLYRWLFNKDFRRARKGGEATPTLSATTPEGGVLGKVADFLHRWVVIPDVQMGWNLFAFGPARHALGRGDADAIYTTSPTESAHLLGLALKKATGRPWVVDLRDPWTFESVNPRLRESRFRMAVEGRMERACFKNADAIVINTPEATRRYKAVYPEYAAKMHTITNGFDEGGFARAAELERPAPWREIPEGAFVISHLGEFFRHKKGDQAPHSLLAALRELLDEGVLTTGNFRVVFAGNLHPDTERRIGELGLGDLIDRPGPIPHLDAMRLMLASDSLVLFDPREDGRTYVRSKLYEYLGSGKPIVGVAPEGASRSLLEKTGRGVLADPDDVPGIKAAIKKSMEGKEEPLEAPESAPPAYERKRLAGELAALLDELVG